MLSFLANWFVKITGWYLYLPIYRPKIHYEDKKVQGRRIKGKAIVCSNHTEVWDFAQILFLFPTRTLRCVVAELMYEKNFFMSTFLKATGSIKVDRNNHDFAWIEKCNKILDKGGVIELYPEARIPLPHEEKPQPFKPSAVYLALQSGAPIIPVYTDGNYFGKGRSHVVIGKPIDARELYDDKLSEQENLQIITDILRNKIIELRDGIKEKQ